MYTNIGLITGRYLCRKINMKILFLDKQLLTLNVTFIYMPQATLIGCNIFIFINKQNQSRSRIVSIIQNVERHKL